MIQFPETWFGSPYGGRTAQKYIAVIQESYKGSCTCIRTPAGEAGNFIVEVGPHQGSALSPLLFTIAMDVLGMHISFGTPWMLLFADDLALTTKSMEVVQTELEKWRDTLEGNDLKISRKKTEKYESGKEGGK